jgi:hypothetical protein
MIPMPPPRWRDFAHEHRFPLRLILSILTSVAVLLAICELKACSSECPDWCVRGIMAVETSSYLKADGSIQYVNQRRGKDGERGITQAMPATLRKYGFSPSLAEQDPAYALAATRFILADYYATTGNWWHAVAKWNRFTSYQSPQAQSYARRVSDAARESK